MRKLWLKLWCCRLRGLQFRRGRGRGRRRLWLRLGRRGTSRSPLDVLELLRFRFKPRFGCRRIARSQHVLRSFRL